MPPLAAAMASWLATPMPATTELTSTAAPGCGGSRSASTQAPSM